MRKIYFLFFAVFSFFVFPKIVSAQLANTYIYASSTGATLDPMTGSTTIVSAGVDDTPSAIQNIGFTFNYEGVPFTQFSASPDGFIKLGAPAAVSQFTNAIVSTTNVPKLFPFWDDLATGVGGSVSFVVTGSAPNRILVVQWFVTVPRATGGPANSTMQTWLYETSGKIEFRYGAGAGPSASASIGINGAVATNFISITTLANTSSTATANNTNTVWPGNGTMYTFLPPPPCVPGSLAGGTTVGPAGTICPGINFNLTVTGASFGTGLTYLWESSTDNVNWSPAAGVNNTIAYTGNTIVNRYYRRKMTCVSTDAFSASVLVTVSAPAPIPFNENFSTYLTVFPPTCWARNNTTLLTGNAVSAFGIGTGSAKYDFWNAASGTQLDLTSLTFNPVGANYFLVFDHAYATFTTQVDSLQILYSTNGGTSYTRLNSYLGGTTGPLNTAGAVGGAFTPTTAQWATKVVALPAGTNQLLFRGYSVFGNNLYLDNIGVTSCVPPTGLNVTGVTTTSATLNWTASTSNPSGGYQWEVRTSGGPGSGATGLAASGSVAAGVTTANATGLTANTNHTYYVRSNCGGSDLSAWASGTFLTPCNPIGIPFVEDFVSVTFPPTCWTRNNTTLLTRQAVSAFGIGTGSAKYDFWIAAAGTQLDLVLPQFTPTTNHFLVFDHAYATFSGEVDSLQILYSTNGGTSYTRLTSYLGGTTGPLNTAGAVGGAFTPTAAQWANKVVALPAGTNRIILRGYSVFGNNLYIDNVAIASCLAPTGLNVTALLPTTVTLNWTASTSNPSGGYQWEVRTSGAAGSGAVGLAASGTTAAGVTTVNVTGLTGNTNYTFYVRSDCGGSDFSPWSAGLFLTPCNPIVIPFLETFASATFPPTCWTRNNTTFLLRGTSSAYGIGAGSARYNFWAATSGTFDLTSPLFAPTTAGYALVFDHAYATFSGEVDRLDILYSTNSGGSYTLLTTYLGGATGPLNTGGVTGNPVASFVPLANQWATKAIALPVGTNRLILRGISAFGDDLFLDNILVTSCAPPTGLNVTLLQPITATLNWTASISNPSGGYEWEVRTSGAPGSGATGLAASGATVAGVTTANLTGLTPNTNYTYYVRSSCSPDFSVWSQSTFLTPCSPIATPFIETFTSATFPPTCWTRNNTTFLLRGASSAFGAGTGSARYNFYAATSGTFDLTSPIFTPPAGTYFLMFDHAYATFSGEVDRLEIHYSTDAGNTYTLLTTYLGGATGPLNTGGITGNPGASFVPTASQWATKVIALPAGANRLVFRGISAFGDDLFLDNIQIATCVPPTGLNLTAISPTTASVSWTASLANPSNGYQWEVRTSGAPGSGATGLAASGTTAAGITTANVTGLTPYTAYSFYVRSDCGGTFSSWTGAFLFTTPCNPTAVPYTENFATYATTFPPNCWLRNNTTFATGQAPSAYGTGSGSARYDFYNAPDGTVLDLISPLFTTLPANYQLVFDHAYATFDPTFIDSLKIMYSTNGGITYTNLITYLGGAGGPLNTGGATTTPFVPGATQWARKKVMLPAGINRIVFRGISGFGNNLFLDNITVRAVDPIDAGVTAVTLPSLNCPTNGVFVQATVTNHNLITADFAAYPVTVRADITGAGTSSVSTVLNTGTLAPGASMSVYLSPAFNFSSGGVYNIKAYTSSPVDTEPINDTLNTSVNVNPNPATPVITPPAPQICIGSSVQLTVATPPATNASVTVTTGPISVAVPDGSVAGVTNALAISGIPSTATITGISVTLNMTHSWISDIAVNLRAPNGSILNLFNRRGGSGDNLTNTVINSTSTTSLATAVPPFTGVFAPDAGIGLGPTGNVSTAANFAALYSTANGNWVLAMRDYVGLDAGTLTSWSITINYSYIPALTWAPVTGLFTNAGTTTQYTAGTNAYSVYAKPDATTTYTATATGAGGCSTSATARVTVNPIPVITIGSIPDTVCISDPVIPLVASPAGGSWSGTGVSGLNFIPPATAVGAYTLTYSYTSEFGCPATATKRIVVKDCPERMILLRDNAVILYPNPNSGRFNIRINSVLYNNLGMRVYSNNGTLVRTQQFSGLAWGRVIPVDLTNLPGGLYMVKFYYEGGPRTSEKTFKVIIGTE